MVHGTSFLDIIESPDRVMVLAYRCNSTPSMRQFIRSTLNPTAYHGTNQTAPFFEGWYFKLVDATQRMTFAIIPGIYKGKDAHAFIMVLDGRTHEVTTIRFPVDEFRAATSRFAIQIGGNTFTDRSLTLNLPNLQGELRFDAITPWPVTLASPGIMGWFAWMPFMECYHGVVSLDHVIRGRLIANGETLDFTGGRGYTEKDWGRSFPQTWVWAQANHFSTVGTSFTASIARIPFKGLVFPGFIIGLWHEGQLHRFTTYAQSKLERVMIEEDRVDVRVRNRRYRLEFSAERETTALLPAPTIADGMVPMVNESVAGVIKLQLSTRRGNVLYAGESRNAGLEIEGDTAILCK